MPPSEHFSHFSRASVEFLVELTENNERQWFKANQARYEAQVREPARAFIRAMQPRLRKLSRQLVASDKKVGGSMMRPQRDTRFGADKTPYKTNVGIQFRHEAGKDVHAPGLYVHFDPAEVFLGAGIWHPDATALAAVRQRILEKPALWRRAQDEDFKKHFQLGGESLKRPPRGVPADHPLLDDLKRKDHIAIATLDHHTLFSPGLLDTIEARFRAARKYVKFICDALDLPY
ncbi:MAG: TIGR02453 family protein [Myxococcales bacterium]|nr:TIGR02453 family protein [Myxococcales bacterium]